MRVAIDEIFTEGLDGVVAMFGDGVIDSIELMADDRFRCELRFRSGKTTHVDLEWGRYVEVEADVDCEDWKVG